MTFNETPDLLERLVVDPAAESYGAPVRGREPLPRPVNYEFAEHPDDTLGWMGKIIGSGEVTLREDGLLILGPGSVYRFSREPQIIRTPLHREYVETQAPASLLTRMVQAGRTRVRRMAMGESAVLNVYSAEKDGASIEISTDNVGEGLYAIELERGKDIIARRGVWFGMERDVCMRPHVPLFSELHGGVRDALIRAAYGPGPILQRFSACGTQTNVLFNFGGSWEKTVLAGGEESDDYDPRHLYAWDHTVSLQLVPYGTIGDMFTQPDEIRYYARLRGPGRVWHSNGAYADGYVGHWLTPASWASTLLGLPGKVVNLFHNPIKPL